AIPVAIVPRNLDQIPPDNTAVARIHHDPEAIAFATAKIGIDPTTTFDHANAVETLSDDCPAFATADAVTHSDMRPIGFRIVPPFIVEVERGAPSVATTLMGRVEAPHAAATGIHADIDFGPGLDGDMAFLVRDGCLSGLRPHVPILLGAHFLLLVLGSLF